MNVCACWQQCEWCIEIFKAFLHSSPRGEPPNFLVKAGLGMAAGVVGSFVGTPAEVSLHICICHANTCLGIALLRVCIFVYCGFLWSYVSGVINKNDIRWSASLSRTSQLQECIGRTYQNDQRRGSLYPLEGSHTHHGESHGCQCCSAGIIFSSEAGLVGNW